MDAVYLAGAGEGGGDGHLHQGPGRHVQLLDRHDGLVQVVVHRHLRSVCQSLKQRLNEGSQMLS